MKIWRRGYEKRVRFLLDRLEPARLMRVADVGANPVSRPAYARLHDLGGCEVYGFEPGDEAFAKLDALQSDRATYYKRAIGKGGPAVFYAHPRTTISSIYPVHAPSARYLGRDHRWLVDGVEEIPMELSELDDIADLPRLDLLKMDLQGGELGVLQGGRDRLCEAVAIIPEVRFYRMYDGEPMWAELDQDLRAQGFVLHKFLTQKSVTLPSSQSRKFHRDIAASQLLDGDAVYIRSLETPEALSDNQLKFLAIAADAVFQSFDLAALCLDHLIERGAVPGGTTRRYINLLPKAYFEGLDTAAAAE